jgi:DNA-binding beta-propeller fold protein YncE
VPLTIAAPPQPVRVYGGFDYVTVDEARDRVYAAHTRSEKLLIVDGATGRVTGQVDVGPMHGVAVDPTTGDVFTGDGTDNMIREVDPVAMKVIARVDVPGNIDDIAYDPIHKRIYADQDNGTGNVYVIDAATMKLVATVPMPSDDLESPAVNAQTGVLYQNLANGGGFAVVDPSTLKVVRVVKTPQLERNHPLIFSAAANQIIVGGENGVLSAYTPDGSHVGDVSVQPHIDQCSTGSKGSLVVCAGKGIVSVVAVKSGAAPQVVAKLDTGHAGIHTVGIDENTGTIWVVWSDTHGDWVQQLRWRSA